MNTREDVMKVSEEAAKAGLNVSVNYGYVTVDPRSILGLFTMMGKEVALVAPDHTNPKEFQKLIRRMGVAC
jgi:hypothetical protein